MANVQRRCILARAAGLWRESERDGVHLSSALDKRLAGRPGYLDGGGSRRHHPIRERLGPHLHADGRNPPQGRWYAILRGKGERKAKERGKEAKRGRNERDFALRKQNLMAVLYVSQMYRSAP